MGLDYPLPPARELTARDACGSAGSLLCNELRNGTIVTEVSRRLLEREMLAAAPPRQRVVIDECTRHPPGPLRYRVFYG